MKHSFYIEILAKPIHINCLLGDLGIYSFYFETQSELNLIGENDWITFLKELDKSNYVVHIRDEYDTFYTIEEFIKETRLDGK